MKAHKSNGLDYSKTTRLHLILHPIDAVCYRRAGLRASSVWEVELRRALAWLWAAVAVVFLTAAAVTAAA